MKFDPAQFDMTVPNRLQPNVSQQQYAEIMAKLMGEFLRSGLQLEKLQDGMLSYIAKKGSGTANVEKFVRELVDVDPMEFTNKAAVMFQTLNFDPDQIIYYSKDFEYSKSQLRILIKPWSKEYSDFVTRNTDFHGCATCLVFDTGPSFAYVNRELIADWNLSDAELFDIALKNTAKDDIETTTIPTQDKDSILYLLKGASCAAANILLIESRFPHTIGKFGSVVAIPSQSVAYIFPIQKGSNLMHFLGALNPILMDRFYSDPAPISDSYFWYYEGDIVPFARKKVKEGEMMMMPLMLMKLFADAGWKLK